MTALDISDDKSGQGESGRRESGQSEAAQPSENPRIASAGAISSEAENAVQLEVDSSSVAEKPAKSRKALKAVGIAACAVVVILVAVYVAGAWVFQNRFLPNSFVGDEDVSLLSADEASLFLADKMDGYALLVEGGDFSTRIMPSDISLNFDADSVVRSMLDSVNSWIWPFEAFDSRELSEFMQVSYSEKELEDVLGKALDSHNAEAVPPTDAFVMFDASAGQFVISPDEVGTLLEAPIVVEAATESLSSLAGVLELDESHLAKPQILRDDSRLVQAAAGANGMILVNTTFTLGGSTALVLDAHAVNPWISFDESYAAVFDEEAMKQWAYDAAAAMSTYQSGRTYKRLDGKEITVSGGSYGWVVDADAFYALVKTAVETDQSGTVAVPTTREASTYDPQGGRDWGNRYVDVDLSEQHARFYNDAGELVWESDIVSGVPGYNTGSITPTGVFTLTSNPTPATLKGTDWDGSKYESKVRYWMPFDGNLIGLHDADWQWAFGGNRYQIGYGSHGCVNLPVDKAYELSLLIGYGDVVVVHW
ncbi:MAG: L,D-transpeptidase family protein [Eggerthellaceae bacterium]|nr:L,D-transpeptidase family protein [Eggerthellaceae bacterium]